MPAWTEGEQEGRVNAPAWFSSSDLHSLFPLKDCRY